MAKRQAWDEICELFQGKFGNRWGLTQIKDQWKRQQSAAKTEYKDYIHQVRQTGGGPAPDKLSLATLLLNEMLPNNFMYLSLL